MAWRPSSSRPSIRTANTVLAALIVACGLGLWLHQPHAGLATESATPAPRPMLTQRPTVLFVGDNFTAGGAHIGRISYPDILGRIMDININVDAEASTGFIEDGARFTPTARRLIDRLDRDKKLYRCDLMIIDAGRNDLGHTAGEILTEVRSYLDRVHVLWPQATVAMLVPAFVAQASPYSQYPALKAGMAELLDPLHGILLDPIGEGWYSGDQVDPASLLGPDGLNPNAAGNQFIAARIADSLRAHGSAFGATS